MTALVGLLAAGDNIPAADRVSPGLLGFLVLLALGIATYLLWRSMNRQLRKVDFVEPPQPQRPSPQPSPVRPPPMQRESPPPPPTEP